MSMAERNDPNTQPSSTADQSPRIPEPAGSVEGTPDVTGQPGVESALGRDRAQGELPRDLGANRPTGDSRAEIDQLAPPPGAVEGSRIGPEGDPTGATDQG